MNEDQAQSVESTDSEAVATESQETNENVQSESQVEDVAEAEGSASQPDYESQYKSLQSDYTRKTQRLSQIEAELAQRDAQLAQLEQSVKQTQAAQQDGDPVREAVKQIEPILREQGFMTKEEMEALRAKDKADTLLAREVETLSTKYNGSDGRPKFDPQSTIDWVLNQSGNSTVAISDLENAYKLMHYEELMNWHLTNASKKKSGTFTEKSDRSGASQSQASDEDLLKKAARTGNFSEVLKKKIRVPNI